MSTEEKPLNVMISHSSMEAMEQCLLKWYYKYIEKLKVDIPRNMEANFGSYIHDVAENFEGGSQKDFKNLAKTILKKYDIDPSIRYKVPLALKNLWKYWNKVIKPLNLTKDNKERKVFANTHEDNFRMMAIFDVMYKNEDGTLTVLDWKTNKKPRDASKQLAFYFYILKMVGEIPEHVDTCKFKIVYLCLEAKDYEPVEIEYVLDDLDLETASSRIDAFIRRVKNKGRNKEKYRKKTGPLCPWCDYYQAGVCKGKDE